MHGFETFGIHKIISAICYSLPTGLIHMDEYFLVSRSEKKGLINVGLIFSIHETYNHTEDRVYYMMTS